MNVNCSTNVSSGIPCCNPIDTEIAKQFISDRNAAPSLCISTKISPHLPSEYSPVRRKSLWPPTTASWVTPYRVVGRRRRMAVGGEMGGGVGMVGNCSASSVIGSDTPIRFWNASLAVASLLMVNLSPSNERLPSTFPSSMLLATMASACIAPLAVAKSPTFSPSFFSPPVESGCDDLLPSR